MGGYATNVEFDTFHVGKTPINYETSCSSSTCITTFTSHGDGFKDPLSLIEWQEQNITKSDGDGPNYEAGGTPYNYNPFSWELEYDRPNDERYIKTPKE